MLTTCGGTVWLTGLPSAGKTTVAQALHDLLLERGLRSCSLDGDVLREGLNADLGFDESDRIENVRRLGEVAILLASRALVDRERHQPLRGRKEARPRAPPGDGRGLRRGVRRDAARGVRGT